MALIKCPECGKEISDKAEKCINCGLTLAEISKNNVQHDTLSKNNSDEKVNVDDSNYKQSPPSIVKLTISKTMSEIVWIIIYSLPLIVCLYYIFFKYRY